MDAVENKMRTSKSNDYDDGDKVRKKIKNQEIIIEQWVDVYGAYDFFYISFEKKTSFFSCLALIEKNDQSNERN